jgi:hypothetical protein
MKNSIKTIAVIISILSLLMLTSCAKPSEVNAKTSVLACSPEVQKSFEYDIEFRTQPKDFLTFGNMLREYEAEFNCRINLEKYSK